MKRTVLLFGAFGLAATVAVAQAPASGGQEVEHVPSAPFPLFHPLQEIPDTFYMNGFRYITLRPFQPWTQPVNDGKTVYLMQTAPRPHGLQRRPAPDTEPPNPAPLITNDP